MAGALHEQKIDAWLAGKILHAAKGRLGGALVLIFLSTAFLSMWMSNTATAALMLPLVIGLLDRIPEKKVGATAPFAVLGVAYSASIGGMGTLVGSPPDAIAFATGRVPQMSMIKAGLLINLLLVLVKAFWARVFWM